MAQLSNITQCLKEQRHSSGRAEDLRNRSQSLQDPTGLNTKAEDRGGQLPPDLGLWAPACSPLDASSHSCLTLYRTWAFGWLSGRWQAMTAVFPSSTSITCCTSNLKSWRSVERRGGCCLGFDGGDMKCSRVAYVSVSLVSINSCKTSHWGLSVSLSSTFCSLEEFKGWIVWPSSLHWSSTWYI